MENFKLKICTAIKQLRLNNNLTQEQFAEKCAISYDSLRKWEVVRNVPSAESIDKICNSCNISIIDLLLLSSSKSLAQQKKIKNICALLNGADDKQLDFITDMIKLYKMKA